MAQEFLLLILSALITSLAFFIQRITGFGSAILATPLLALFWNPHSAINLLLIYQALFGFILFGKTWKSLTDKKLLPFLILFLPMVIAGAYILPKLSEGIIRWAIAGVTISVLLQWIFFPKVKAPENWIKPFGVGLGFLSGGIQGMFGAGGPFFLAYYGSVEKKPSKLRDASIAVFAIANFLRIPVAVSTAQISGEVLWAALFTLIPFAAALYFGGKLSRKINEDYFRYAVIGILLVASISLIFR